MQAVQEAETGQRGFLITADTDYLKAYEEGMGAVAIGLQTVKLPPGATVNREELVDVVNRKMAELAETVKLGRQGPHEPAIQIVRSNLGLHLSRRLRTMADNLVNDFQLDVRRSSEKNWRSVSALKKTILCSFFISLLMISGGFRSC